MKIESIILKGFRCFGPEGTTIIFEPGVTALVGSNGSGKTALFQALMRLFGVTQTQRRVKKQDFHIPVNQSGLQSGATLSIDVVLSFPELDNVDNGNVGDAVPEFFRQMVATGPGEPLKVRIILRATWTDDGTPNGSIEEDIHYVKTLNENFDWDNDCQKVPAYERSTIQLIYVPATRNAEEQVTSFLKGRLWQAAKWSSKFRQITENTAKSIQEQFQNESPAQFVLERLKRRWKQVHEADTDSTPVLRLIEHRFEEFVRKADFAFYPDEAGQERSLAELSDGQRSLFHIALTAAILEIERDIHVQNVSDFDQEKIRKAHLTILAIEEPENSLSPFFLSRIMALARDIGNLDTAQVIISSHSAAILSRIEPKEVRYFRLNLENRQSSVRKLTLPSDDLEASKYVRLAVRAYPELYFAKFVILVEGDSERLIIPRIAEAMSVSLDPSFVPIVPLGGRHCTHFWKLLSDLQIPFVTLLDLDIGRRHGGANIIRDVVDKLAQIGVTLNDINLNTIDTLKDSDLWNEDNYWLRTLEEKGIFFSHPLDFDFAMLRAFPEAYKNSISGGHGPAQNIDRAKEETLKTGGDGTLYGNDYNNEFQWYPYLFLRRSKPETHLAALARISDEDLSAHTPHTLKCLIEYVKVNLGL
mgnify:CR=1 FL=1